MGKLCVTAIEIDAEGRFTNFVLISREIRYWVILKHMFHDIIQDMLRVANSRCFKSSIYFHAFKKSLNLTKTSWRKVMSVWLSILWADIYCLLFMIYISAVTLLSNQSTITVPGRIDPSFVPLEDGWGNVNKNLPMCLSFLITNYDLQDQFNSFDQIWSQKSKCKKLPISAFLLWRQWGGQFSVSP
jgi:hypothetical protein